MSVSLKTPIGILLITNSYLPSDVDNFSNNAVRYMVIDQHSEIANKSKTHDHSILCMDGNETNCREGRISTLMDGVIRYTGKNHTHLGTTTMKPYINLKNPILDLHHTMHSVNRPYPTVEDMTHFQPGKNPVKLVASKIDYHMTTPDIASRCISCYIDDTPKYWRNNKEPHHRKSYHSALISTFKIPGIWGDSVLVEEDDKSTLKGTCLAPFPRSLNSHPQTQQKSRN
jgi:exonuclease III